VDLQVHFLAFADPLKATYLSSGFCSSVGVHAMNVKFAELITLSEAAQLLPRRGRGRPVHCSTLYRWASRGVGGVRLKVARVGGVIYTHPEWLAEFLDRPGWASGESRTDSPPIPHADVERALDARGI
jgi:hypothetical protein